ncbi:MAG: hypothetical protein BroJett003_27020 [Planctomycetota bacterium]|nr:MAG: hypothetical protein BroJett003_27020 [Planctomycetota bacterium]
MLPLILVGPTVICLTGFFVVERVRRRRNQCDELMPRCPECEYSLRGLKQSRCSEYGKTFAGGGSDPIGS